MTNRKYPNWITEKIDMKSNRKSTRDMWDTVKRYNMYNMDPYNDRGKWGRNNIWRYNTQEYSQFEKWYQCTNSWISSTDSRINHEQHKENHTEAHYDKIAVNQKARQGRESRYIVKARNWGKAGKKRMDYLDDPLSGTPGRLLQRWRWKLLRIGLDNLELHLCQEAYKQW